jgi:hypothetical protein
VDGVRLGANGVTPAAISFFMEKFVCAFRGRRDAYQVPLALAEGDLLEAFITDAYATPLATIAARLAFKATRSKLKLRRAPASRTNVFRVFGAQLCWSIPIFSSGGLHY